MLDSSCRVITRADMDINTDNEALVDALLLENPTEGMDGNLGEIKVTIHRAVHIIREKIRKENWDSESSDDSEDDDDSDGASGSENEGPSRNDSPIENNGVEESESDVELNDDSNSEFTYSSESKAGIESGDESDDVLFYKF